MYGSFQQTLIFAWATGYDYNKSATFMWVRHFMTNTQTSLGPNKGMNTDPMHLRHIVC